MTTAMHEDWGGALTPSPPRLTEVPRPPRDFPGWVLLAVFPVAVALTVFTLGGANGRTPAAVRVEVRDAGGDLATAGRVADRLNAAGMSVVRLRPVSGIDGVGGVDGSMARTEIRYRGESDRGLARAKSVHRAVGTGTIVRSSDAPGGVDVILLIGKDVQNE